METTSDAINQYLDALTTPHSSCWFKTQDYKVEIPMISIDYKIKILNNFCIIALKQKFINPLDQPIDLHFSYAVDPNFCLGKLEAFFDGYRVAGIVKEREVAIKEFQAEK